MPGAHANVVVCTAALGQDGGDLAVRLVAEWAHEGYSGVVLDLQRRHAGGARIDPSSPGWPEDLEVAMRSRRVPAVVALDVVPEARRSAATAAALTAVRRHRAHTGRPHWLVLDPAAPLFADPDVPPEALDLSAAGHCLVVRDHAEGRSVGSALRGSVDVAVPCGPGCPLA